MRPCRSALLSTLTEPRLTTRSRSPESPSANRISPACRCRGCRHAATTATRAASGQCGRANQKERRAIAGADPSARPANSTRMPRPATAGVQSVFDQFAQALLSLLFLVGPDQLTQMFARAAVLPGLHALVNAGAQGLRQREALAIRSDRPVRAQGLAVATARSTAPVLKPAPLADDQHSSKVP